MVGVEDHQSSRMDPRRSVSYRNRAKGEDGFVLPKSSVKTTESVGTDDAVDASVDVHPTNTDIGLHLRFSPYPGAEVVGPSPRFGFWSAGHRAACWVLLGITFCSLVAAAVTWSLVVNGRWLALGTTTVSVTFAILVARGHFRVRMVPDTSSRIPLIAVAVAAGGGVGFMVTATPRFGQPNIVAVAWLLVALTGAAIASQALGSQALKRLWTRGQLRSRALVYGCDELATEMAIEIDLRREYGVDVVGFIGAGQDRAEDGPVAVNFETIADVVELIDVTKADRLIIGPATGSGDEVAVAVARAAGQAGVAVFVVPRLFEMGLGMDSMSPDRVRGYPLVRLQRSVHPQIAIRVKRLFDIAVASGVLLLTAPVSLLAALAVKVTSPGPVLFRQVRIGQHGKEIEIAKFRSMTESRSSDTEWTADARVTRVGSFLRRTNIDELPQLWSIVKGDMSLVGPRPERPAFVERFGAQIPSYDLRHRMPVGLTGLAQIVGLRGDTSIEERVKYDNIYIDQWSFQTDLQILVKTAAAVLRQKRYATEALELEMALQSSTSVRSKPSRSR